MTFETILFDVADGIVTITLNRPERANTFNDQLKADLTTAMKMVETDKSMRVVIVTGAGRHFSAGGDLKATRAPMIDAFGKATPVFITAFHDSRVPVIAAINGVAKGGGCELALACDIRVMVDTARIGLPEINFGGVPAGGGTQRLPRTVGAAVAKEMIFFGHDKTAEEALRIGLVNRVVAPDDLMLTCRAMAMELVERPAFALTAAKRLINGAMDMRLDDGLDREREVSATMATPEERRQAMDAAAARNPTYAKIFAAGGTPP
jgi:enoyl-CoA hydratase